MRKRNVGGIVAIVLGVILSCATFAYSESLYWTGATTTTDGQTFTPEEMATMTYYVRIDKPNPRDTTGAGGWYYLGESRNGASSYPADNSLASLMRSYGFSGTQVQFTVSQAFKGSDGVERDSDNAPALAWTVPVPFLPKTSVAPGGLLVK